MKERAFLPREAFSELISALRAAGYCCLGPQVREGAILYDALESADELPVGASDDQSPGHYRLTHSASNRCFAWANGPQALKPLTFAPQETLWRVSRDEDGRLAFIPEDVTPEPTAVIGIRACDLAALTIQERHFQNDPRYLKRRESLFLVAVHCTHPAETCFCASTGDGPEAHSGFDLALHEVDEGYFIAAGSKAGEQIKAQLDLETGSEALWQQAQTEVDQTAKQQQRALPDQHLHQALQSRSDHPHWKEVGARCLSCGNCTSVCPTCFCHAEQELPALDGTASRHERVWDSCFTSGHSYIHGKVLREDTASRYRQWLTHKLDTWHEQMDRSGCVGCGRCISWCPVGIDLTQEVQAFCGATNDA
ncbi:MAG: 4Fe-4S dicluster domain-containing protein [Thiotrichales bacterium]